MTRSFAMVFVSAAVALAAGCASRAETQREAQTWVGAADAQLRAQWGEPTASVPAGGETILRYDTSRVSHVDGRPAMQVPGMNGQPTTTIPAVPAMDIAVHCTWSFALQAGKVVRVESAGNDCASMPGPARGL